MYWETRFIVGICNTVRARYFSPGGLNLYHPGPQGYNAARKAPIHTPLRRGYCALPCFCARSNALVGGGVGIPGMCRVVPVAGWVIACRRRNFMEMCV